VVSCLMELEQTLQDNIQNSIPPELHDAKNECVATLVSTIENVAQKSPMLLSVIKLSGQTGTFKNFDTSKKFLERRFKDLVEGDKAPW